MKKMFAVVLLASVALVACKKPSTPPATPDKAPLERKDDSTGGATYGGPKTDAPAKDTPDPNGPNAPR
jgi:hypothetical protein